MRRTLGCAWLVLGLVAGSGRADEAAQADLARRLHEAVLKKVPREYEDRSDWGKTIPPPPAVRFPRLRRTVVQVDGRMEFPHGTWKRTFVRLADPDRDLHIRVPEFRKVDKDTRRLRVEATVALEGFRERQDWVNGVRLLGITAEADAVVTVGVDVSVKVGFDLKKPLDGVKVEAKTEGVQLELREFKVRRVGPVMIVELGQLGEELKAALQQQLRAYEPKAKEYVERLVADTLKESKLLRPAPTRPEGSATAKGPCSDGASPFRTDIPPTSVCAARTASASLACADHRNRAVGETLGPPHARLAQGVLFAGSSARRDNNPRSQRLAILGPRLPTEPGSVKAEVGLGEPVWSMALPVARRL
jgi:hypothetical protein